MNNFKGISGLHDFISSIYKSEEGEPGKTLFKNELQKLLLFTPEQANRFSSIVLTRNSNVSAHNIRMNANKLVGSWVHMDQFSGVGYINNKTNTWIFKEDLTYEHKIEKYESSMNLGSAFNFSIVNNPQPVIESGIWAPSDILEQTFEVATITYSGYASYLKITMRNNELTCSSCKINGLDHARQ